MINLILIGIVLILIYALVRIILKHRLPKEEVLEVRLLQLLKKGVISELHSHVGLCTRCFFLKRKSLITETEYVILMNIIEINRPNSESKAYYWPINDVRSRLNFIDSLIIKYKNIHNFKSV